MKEKLKKIDLSNASALIVLIVLCIGLTIAEPAFGSVNAKPANAPGATLSAKYCPCSLVPARITFLNATKEVTNVMA